MFRVDNVWQGDLPLEIGSANFFIFRIDHPYHSWQILSKNVNIEFLELKHQPIRFEREREREPHAKIMFSENTPTVVGTWLGRNIVARPGVDFSIVK